MTKQFWLTLPVKNVKRSVDFFTELGFSFNPNYPVTDQGACLLMGDHSVVVMLFEEATFQQCLGGATYRPGTSPEVILSIDAASKEEVDVLTAKAVKAGATSTHQPSAMQGWMYGSLFTDLDRHQWNILYMDMSKMPTPNSNG